MEQRRTQHDSAIRNNSSSKLLSYTQLNKNSEAVKWTLEKLRDHFIDNDLDFETLYDQICDIVAKVFVGVENNFTDPVNRMPDHR